MINVREMDGQKRVYLLVQLYRQHLNVARHLWETQKCRGLEDNHQGHLAPVLAMQYMTY